MSVVNAGLMLSAPSGYTIDRSLRFRSSASAYLNRTPASAGNRKTWTWSGWVKRGSLGANQVLMSSDVGTSVNTWMEFGFDTSDKFYLSSYSGARTTTSVFRDPSAWYHIVCVVDTTQSTEDDRFQLYVNRVLQTDSGDAFPALNTDYGINNNQIHGIGYRNWASGVGRYFDGYLTEVNFIDGQALDPTDFGEYNEDTSVWQAKKYTGTYGTNGFYLNFSDNSSTTTLGEDGSSNSNDWTLNNFSLTSGSTYDSMTDVPTLTSETSGNYTVGNPLMKRAGLSSTGTNANLSWSGSAGAGIFGTMKTPATSKWYFEVTPTAIGSGVYVGLDDGTQQAAGSYNNSVVYLSNGNKNVGGTSSAYGATFTTSDIVGVAVDCDSGTITFYKNNTSQGAITTTVTNKFPFVVLNTSATANLNFGQRPFSYTPPAGFKALNTYNLPDSTIEDGSQHFDTVLRTGTGTADGQSQIISSLAFTPDFVWNKGRSLAFNHNLVDSVRGNDTILFSNLTNAETSVGTTGTQLQITTNGFTAIQRVSYQALNQNGVTYADWCWKAGGTGVSNTDGSITSTVSANTTAGFSIVTWTGNSVNASTIGHGLGVAPKLLITKSRTNASSWVVGIGNISGFGVNDYLVLQTTGAKGTSSTFYQAYGASTFTVGVSAANEMNKTSNNYVTYCFAEVEGFSKMGSYTGNGSADGPFIYTGFRPAFVMFKRSDSTSNWTIVDLEREGYNVDNDPLYPNLTNAEGTTNLADILSNGFKLRSTDASVNASSGTYIFIAFAENPFKNSLAR